MRLELALQLAPFHSIPPAELAVGQGLEFWLDVRVHCVTHLTQYSRGKGRGKGGGEGRREGGEDGGVKGWGECKDTASLTW